MNSYQLQVMCSRPSKLTSVYDMDAVTDLAVQLEALSKNVDGIPAAQYRAQVMQCDFCGVGYRNYECQAVQVIGIFDEQVDYLGNTPRPKNNPYSNTYNP